MDDHEDSRDIVAAVLSKDNYRVTTCASCADGLRRAKAGDFDLFLLDFHFKDGTGKELCERIREFDRETPIRFYSGSHPIQQQDAATCGAQGFVMKPDFEALRREISRVLSSPS